MDIETVDGEIARVKDNQQNRVAWTEYDEANRVAKKTAQNGTNGSLIYRTTLGYDGLEHVSSQFEEVGGGQYITLYSYDWDDRVTQVGYGADAYRIRYTYDSQGRLSKRRVNNGSADQTATYSYLASGVGIPGLDTKPSTNLVSGISQPGVSFTYGYAGNTDNIVSETRTGGGYAGTTTYGYDSVGQLTRVNDAKDSRGGSGGTTWVYIYYLDGNLTNKTRYAYTAGTDQLKGAMRPMINQTHCSFEMLTQHSTGISK